MDVHFEAVEQPSPALAAEGRFAPVKLIESLPENRFDEGCGANLVGMREVVARRRRHAEAGDGADFEPQPVTDIIEAQRMGQLHKNHGGHVAPDTEAPGFGIDPVPGGRRADDGARNILEELPQHVDVMTGWLGGWRMDRFG